LLQEKAGSKGSLREFRRMVREIIEAHTLPEYRMTLDAADKVTFYVRNPHLTRLLTRSSGQSWRRPVAGGRHWTHRALLSNAAGATVPPAAV
jgi:Replication initiator protein A.